MRNLITAIGLIAASLAMQPFLAEAGDSNPSGVYFGADVGLDVYNDDPEAEFDPGVLLGFKLGYRWSEHFRTEVELGGSVADADDGDELTELGYVRFTGGVYYDFLRTSQTFVPYAGGGVGLAAIFVDDEDGFQDDGEALLTLHGEVGLAININEHLALTPSYRLTWIEDDSVSLDENLTTHAFKVGARLSF